MKWIPHHKYAKKDCEMLDTHQNFVTTSQLMTTLKLAIHFSFLAFWHARTLFHELFGGLQTNHYTLLTISSISFILDSTRNLMRNLSYCPLKRFMKVPITWREWRNARWEKWLARRITKCHLYTSRFSRFANIFSRSRQFNDYVYSWL